MTDLFVYGTLQDPEVLGLLLDDLPALTPVTLPGWRVAPVRGQVYPGLVRDPHAVAAGNHLCVGPADLDVLDRFEGDGYDRREVGTVVVDDRDVTVQAWVVRPGHVQGLGAGTWTLAMFADDPGRARWIAAIQRGLRAPRD
jgi:gamma-glutamylcyclotransferase (GGCT)/AIG2-like uncharacterized protein YtfP